MNSEADIEKNGTFASPATARASSVLPVPGGPLNNTPRGMRPPSLRYFSGCRRKSTTSVSSAFASSMPATSSNVTRSAEGLYRRARERPNDPSARPAPRRINKSSSPSSRIVGPNPYRSVSHHGADFCSDSALMTTSLASRSCDSAPVSANDGISVVNRREDFPLVAGYVTGRRKSPWIEAPSDVMRGTFPSRTWSRNVGLYGMRTRGGGESDRDATQ